MSTFLGWLGEIMTRFGMFLFLDTRVYQRFHNVIIPTSNGTTQIDHLLVSPFGLFVIETKNIKGWIFGSEDQPKWTQSIYGKKFTFQNPLHQNYRHIKCLAEHLDLEPEVMHSVVFFIGECTFKTEMPPNVFDKGLTAFIRSYTEILLSEGEIQEIVSAIHEVKADSSLSHSTHMESLRQRHESTTTCPKCGSSLATKTARRGPTAGSQFLGCSSYPACRYTKQLS